jgi:histidinol-phosphate aminotransferase
MQTARLIRSQVLGMQDLLWGDEEGLALKWGYNPFPPSPKVLECLRSCDTVDVAVYPSRKLKQALVEAYADYAGVKPEQVTLTNGCDKAFRLLPEVFVEEGDELLMFSPSYPLMEEAVQLMGGKTRVVPFDSDYRINVDDLERSGAITARTKLLFLVNPNNPTSNVVIDENGLERLLRIGRIVVVDEAYFEFGGWSSAQYLDRYPNLIVLRSLSKSMALPGIRVAFVLADATITKYFRRIEDNLELFNIPVLSLKAANAALQDLGYYRQIWGDVTRYRAKVAAQLSEWGVGVLDSRTTFLFVTTPGVKTQSIRTGMARDGIVIKNMGLYKNVSEYQSVIGLPPQSEYDRVLASLQRALGPANLAPEEFSP